MADDLSTALAAVVADRIRSGEWTVIAVASAKTAPSSVREWIGATFSADDAHVLVVIHQKAK